ncbi:MAG: hypothetical protein CMO74_00835 [Verrucomicrobiales bacterium]|nr:hypothetical protein [Verrucomicrobiales bacterium]|tara:strand:- start:776 stop:1555 length:780 start_codon:yes stop_codon:yes gene_type:complete
MTRRQKKAITPEEWDFRSLTEDELYAAAKYEYAREIVSPKQAREARAKLNNYEKTAPKDTLTAIPAVDGLSCLLMYFSWEHPKFPLPWLKLPPRTRTKYAKNTRQGIIGNLFDGFITAIPSPDELEVSRMVELIESESPKHDIHGVYSWHFAQINWLRSDKQILAEFQRWLKAVRPTGVKPVVVKGKKAQSNDHTLLKWLAAYRLDSTGMNFTTAQRHINEHVGKKLNDTLDVLPRFSHASGWHAAIRKAITQIRRTSA